MSEMLVEGPYEVTFEAVVTRCGCETKGLHPNAVCPNPSSIEDRGVIAQYDSTKKKEA